MIILNTIDLYKIISEMFGAGSVIIYPGLIGALAVIIITIAITRSSRKAMILSLPISLGIYFTGITIPYWFMFASAIAFFVGIWSNEFDEKQIEFYG